ncbi:unnamed protein product, partial [Effrenium voratum]
MHMFRLSENGFQWHLVPTCLHDTAMPQCFTGGVPATESNTRRPQLTAASKMLYRILPIIRLFECHCTVAGLVPCLVDGSLAVWESHSIVRYLAQKYAPELHLGTVEGMARCSPWMDWLLFSQFHECNHHFIDQTARTLPADRDVGLMARSYEGYVEKLQKVEEQIGETDAYVTGRDFSIADIVIGAELCRFSCGMTRWAREPRGFPTLVQLPNLERYFR